MTRTFQVGNTPQLVELLRSRPSPKVRLSGTGSRTAWLPRAPSDAALVQLRGLRRIDRLEPDDLTCSIEPGLRRDELDQELEAQGLELACAGGGSIGGLFATDPIGATIPGGPQPRSLLLGMTAVLADGTRFCSGARVVKSVAGFDVHKLLVGSRGVLFAATLLHLKLRHRARSSFDFVVSGLDAAAATDRFLALCTGAGPLQRVQLRSGADGGSVEGTLAGRSDQIRAARQRFALREAGGSGADHLTARAGMATLVGSIRLSRAERLVAALPTGAELLLRGGGRFEVTAPPAAAMALLRVLPGIDAHGMLLDPGADDGSLATTAEDPGAAALSARIKQNLDPDHILA